MDPTEALKQLRERIAAFHDTNLVDAPDLIENMIELVTTFEGLDAWLSNGGFLPDDWAR
jgi:hypothetical protein